MRRPARPAPRSTPKPSPAPAPKPTPKPAPRPTPAPSSSPSPTPPPQTSTPTTGPNPSTGAPSRPTPQLAVDPNKPLVATPRERLYLNRFGTGFTQKALVQLRNLGGPEAWLEAQLDPGSVPESPKIADIDSWFAPQARTPSEKYATDLAKTKRAFEYNRDLGSWALMRRIHSERPLLETLVDFWSNALHIPTGTDYAWVYRYDYDATIRKNAVGTFEQLLLECSLHPAMRAYLGNWRSVKNKPNENQGREVLELHTVGRTAGYTEAMVKSSAAILSGYTVDWGNTFAPRYDPNAHTTGPVQVLGFSHPNGSSDGQAVALAYLTYLARHPATAQRIARKVATYFVSDTPSQGLVDSLANAFTASGTDIKAVLRAVSQHPEFLTSEGLKVRTPAQDMVALVRSYDMQATTPTSQYSLATWANYLHGGDLLFSWPRPDGAPLTGDRYASVQRIFASLQSHKDMLAGDWPKDGVTYRQPASWLPAPSIRLDSFVEHLSRTWFGRSAPARVVTSACQAVGFAPSTVINDKHLVATWYFRRLAMALFDSPDHMTT